MFHLSPSLPGPAAASQVIWTALGPRAWLRPHAVQDWAGLLLGAIESPAVVAARYDITRQTLFNWRTLVVDFAAGIEVPPPVVKRLTRPTAPREDHTARQRQAWLVGLRIGPPTMTTAEWGLVRSSTRILAPLGEISIAELTAALNRARPLTRPEPLTTNQVAALMSKSHSAQMSAGRVRLAQYVDAWPADRALLEAAGATGRAVHTYDQARELLAAAGYARSLQPTLTYHPLLRHEGRGLWSVRLHPN